MIEFGPGIVGGKPPVDGDTLGIACFYPGVCLLPECREIWDAPIEALTAEHRDLDLGHIQSASGGACLGV